MELVPFVHSLQQSYGRQGFTSFGEAMSNSTDCWREDHFLDGDAQHSILNSPCLTFCKNTISFQLFKSIFLFSPVGLQRNRSLLEIIVFFSRGLKKMECSLLRRNQLDQTMRRLVEQPPTNWCEMDLCLHDSRPGFLKTAPKFLILAVGQNRLDPILG